MLPTRIPQLMVNASKMFVSEEWKDYAKSRGIVDSSLPGNHDEILALRNTLTQIECETQKRLKRTNEFDKISVTAIHIPARDGYQIRCLLYVPKINPPYPVYVYMHGGGWVVGRPETDDISNRNLCERNNTLIISVDYRLSPEHPFPIPINDCEDVLLWSHKNVHKYGGSVDNGIILGGFSAGGQLAGSLAIRAVTGDISVPIRGLVLRSPWLSDWRSLPKDHENSLTSITENANAPFVSSQRLFLMLEWFSVPELERRKQTVFPLNVDLETAGKLPPTVIQVSGADPLRDDGVVFRNILAAAGTDVLFFHYKGMPHGFHTHQLATAVKAEEDMQTAIRSFYNRPIGKL